MNAIKRIRDVTPPISEYVPAASLQTPINADMPYIKTQIALNTNIVLFATNSMSLI